MKIKVIDKDTDNQHSAHIIKKDKTVIINNDRTVIASLVNQQQDKR